MKAILGPVPKPEEQTFLRATLSGSDTKIDIDLVDHTGEVVRYLCTVSENGIYRYDCISGCGIAHEGGDDRIRIIK